MAPSSPRPSSSRPSSQSSSSSSSSEGAGSSTKKRQLIDYNAKDIRVIGGGHIEDERDNSNSSNNNNTRSQSYGWPEQDQPLQFSAGDQSQAAVVATTSTIASTSTAASNNPQNAAHSSHSHSAYYRLHFSCQHVGKYRRSTKRRLNW